MNYINQASDRNSAYTEWAHAFPRFAELGDEAGKTLRFAAHTITDFPAETAIFSEGDECQNFVMVISGSVKVFKRSAQQRELLLYRVCDGQTCALTTACLLSGLTYPAAGQSEIPVRAVTLTKAEFDHCMQESAEFRDVVFNSYGNQLLHLVGLVEGLAFEHVDERIARYLVKAAKYGSVVNVTHQQLAQEVGSVRGVVSRELDRMRDRNWINMGRGRIEILDLGSLSEMVLKEIVTKGDWAK